MYRIGIDVGGTFTDVTLLDAETGKYYNYKLSSTPQDQSVAIANGAREAMKLHAVDSSEINYFGHGTTVATNMIIERKGAKTALLTTKGFGDILEIARQVRPSLYDINADKPEPLIRRSLRKEITERICADGSVYHDIDRKEIIKTLEDLKSEGVQSLAVCFLFSYLNDRHERIVEECIKEVWPEVYYSVSSSILPEFREFERLSTTVINSYLGPKMKQYIDNLRTRVQKEGISVEPYITQSNGGVMSISSTIQTPVQTALSGPSAGVVGAIYTCSAAGFRNLITYDMGGTSTDVSLVLDGTPEYTTKRKICGLPSGIPMIDVHAVGAGGGSIAHIDTGGALKVGPESAGADPGPACYDLGGKLPVVTDANLALGRLNAGYILGGRMKLHKDKAEEAIRKAVAEPLNMTVQQAAMGIINVVNSNMARAIRVITVERGYNPSDFTLVAYGGAGPLHAVQLAKEMSIRKVIIPPSPGTLCSLGLLTADIRKSHVRTQICDYEAISAEKINEIFAPLIEEGDRWLQNENVPADKRAFRNVIEMRYVGQNYELQVEVPGRKITDGEYLEIRDKFFKEHEKNYGYFNPSAPIQLINFRSEAVGVVTKPELSKIEVKMTSAKEAVLAERTVYFEEAGEVVCPVYDRSKLGRIERVEGPCIIEQMDSTSVIPPGTWFKVDDYGNIIVTVSESGN